MGIAEQIANGFTELKGFFQSRQSAVEIENAELKERIAGFEKQILGLNGSIELKDKEIFVLKGEVEAANKGKEAAEKQAKETEASVDKRANQKALAIEQQRGVSVSVKAEEAEGQGGSGTGLTLMEQYRRITDPKARAEFFKENEEGIWSGK